MSYLGLHHVWSCACSDMPTGSDFTDCWPVRNVAVAAVLRLALLAYLRRPLYHDFLLLHTIDLVPHSSTDTDSAITLSL